MRAPMSWLHELVELPVTANTQQIAEALTRAGLQVEHIDKGGDQLSGPIVVGRVLDFADEPQRNGKTIRWCRVDVGVHNPAGQNWRSIVCGAHNFAPGDHVVVALPGAVLAGNFEISARRTYGHLSDGMICAEDELGIGEDHTGIIVLPARPVPEPGTDALVLMGVREETLDIDVTPDCGYCLSMRGLAREAAQAFDVDFVDHYATPVPATSEAGYPVHLESADCSLFVALSVHGVDPQAATPGWMVQRLRASGMRSISLLVDITNYVMLESGQPLHAYDESCLSGPIVVRKARPGERLTTLDGTDRELSPEDLLITDASGPIGLAGVMGGLTTELRSATSEVVLEAACFRPATIGRSYRRHKLPSEASRRFERGVDPGLGYAAALRAATLMEELAGGTLVEQRTIVGGVPQMPTQVIDEDLPARILGAPVSPQRVIEVLRASGVDVQQDRRSLRLTPPTWRGDLVDPYDYVEEVGRKVGLDRIPRTLPKAAGNRGWTSRQARRWQVLEALAQAGFAEVITLPFIAEEEISRLGVQEADPRRALVRLANPLADTQPLMRSTLLPGLFAAIARNTSRSLEDLALFECGSVFRGSGAGPAPLPEVDHRPAPEELAALDASLPDQPHLVAGVLAGNWLPAGWQGGPVPADWTHAVLLAETAARAAGVQLVRQAAELAPWHPGRCALLQVHRGGELVTIGAAGEVHPEVCRAFDLPARSCAVEFDLGALLDADPVVTAPRSLSTFPLTKQDVALVVDAEVPAEQVRQSLIEGGGELVEAVRLFDVYVGPQVGEHKKSLAFALDFRAFDRTLTDQEAGRARDAAVALAAERHGAVQRV